MYYTYVDTPIGPLLIAGEERVLRAIRFAPAQPERGWSRSSAIFADVARQLNEYFAGVRRTFDLELAMDGTAFQCRVWSALREIPYGEVRTYGQVAREVARAGAARAVGAANGANPIPIIVPCHRVIGSNGTLTGFGGGLHVKRHLLELEKQASLSTMAV